MKTNVKHSNKVIQPKGDSSLPGPAPIQLNNPLALYRSDSLLLHTQRKIISIKVFKKTGHGIIRITRQLLARRRDDAWLAQCPNCNGKGLLGHRSPSPPCLSTASPFHPIHAVVVALEEFIVRDSVDKENLPSPHHWRMPLSNSSR